MFASGFRFLFHCGATVGVGVAQGVHGGGGQLVGVAGGGGGRAPVRRELGATARGHHPTVLTLLLRQLVGQGPRVVALLEELHAPPPVLVTVLAVELAERYQDETDDDEREDDVGHPEQFDRDADGRALHVVHGVGEHDDGGGGGGHVG